MDGNRSPIQVIISLRNDMMLDEKQTKAPFGAAGTRGWEGDGRVFFCFLFLCFSSSNEWGWENNKGGVGFIKCMAGWVSGSGFFLFLFLFLFLASWLCFHLTRLKFRLSLTKLNYVANHDITLLDITPFIYIYIYIHITINVI